MKFKKGQSPWNKGLRKNIDLEYIKNKYLEGFSCLDISKEFNVSSKTIGNRLKDIGIDLRKRHSSIIKVKIKETLIKNKIQPIKRYNGKVWNKGLTKEDERVRRNIQGLLKNRKTQVLPKKDTSIEIKIQNILKSLEIEFLTHQYININHGYQCDILIPKQDKINQKTIIECFGDYWHKYPEGREIDYIRKQELEEQGWKVIILWEHEIKKMNKTVLTTRFINFNSLQLK